MDGVQIGVMDSPIGRLTLTSTNVGLRSIDFGVSDDNHQLWQPKKVGGTKSINVSEQILQRTSRQLEQYFAGKRMRFDIPLDIKGTLFQQKVWKALLSIPYGTTRSYQDIANVIGSPRAVRAIGGANHRNPLPIIIPCHRVIGINGALTGYRGGIEKKLVLLSLEGVKFTSS